MQRIVTRVTAWNIDFFFVLSILSKIREKRGKSNEGKLKTEKVDVELKITFQAKTLNTSFKMETMKNKN